MTIQKETVLAVHIQTGTESDSMKERRIRELNALIYADGGEVVETKVKKINTPHNATFLGKGQLFELNRIIAVLGTNVVVFDKELTPAQQRNIESILQSRIIDRSRLIIDIFARRAHSKYGKLEVEQALLRYLLPRLTGRGVLMSQTGGGVGTRGPGETKLEIDKRRIKERLTRIKRLIDIVKRQRITQQAKRSSSGTASVAMVGYTSAGKSTLLNTLTKSNMQTSDELFTTLDPVARRINFKDKSYAIINDTVGFIENLPVQLIEAFKTTLDDVVNADIVLHVIDISKPDFEKDIEEVEKVLYEIGAGDKQVIYVFNKTDMIRDNISVRAVVGRYDRAVAISAKQGIEIELLKDMIHKVLINTKQQVRRVDNELYRAI
ncbi:MAG: GTPase HflX [Deltaproteobacteria bacterium]|nr:GTPase HflX [Deltaproteobacteria bacterium]MCL5792795.1 GTPase HflX [Deltaproteobacteria bacterium]